MSWKRHMKLGKARISTPSSSPTYASGYSTNFASYLPDVYTGFSNRVDRYRMYDQMDQDPEIKTALDILADFTTQNSEDYDIPIKIKYKDTNMGENIVTTLEDRLDAWAVLNDFKVRMYEIVRNTFKYGDQFFIRDPETCELYYVHPMNVEKIVVNEKLGKKPIIYYIRDVSLNIRDKVFTNVQQAMDTAAYPGTLPNSLSGSGSQYGTLSGGGTSGGNNSTPFGTGGQMDIIPVDAEHVIHISLNTGLDAFWPFGTSILESIFKTYKQKELLEDSIIIYRVQRAPERRVFKIDVGDMPATQAMAAVERLKNEIHQRRIPSNKGGTTSLMDAAYNPMCLDMNTRIPLLDGRTLTIWELAEEYRAGKENWVYSCHPTTGEIVPGNITWAGVTKQSSKVVKITMDNGKELICTADHKIPVLGYGFKEAQDLLPSDSLISFNTKYDGVCTASSDRTYQQVYDHSKNGWEFTHRMVGNYFHEIGKHQEFTYLPENIGKHKNIIHHKDFNRYNNDPRNLQYMNLDDHIKYHCDFRKEMWESMSPEEYQRISNKISTSLKNYHNSLSDKQRKVVYDNIMKWQAKFLELRKDPEYAKQYNEKLSISRKKYIDDNPEFKDMLLNNISEQMAKPWCNTQIVYTRDMLGRIVDIVKANKSNRLKTIELCDNDVILMDMFRKANPKPSNGIDNIDREKWGYKKLDKIILKYGFKNWKHFFKSVNEYNHKVVKIEVLEDEMTVGTITVDGNERWHNFHTFAIENGIFVKNSILEDYFFPQTSDGRGSSVETLPGGENLGQIDDLRYFNNKLIRGLGIPSSYLPFGPEDGNTMFSDGGTARALIQEHRFNKQCQRWQNIIVKTLDTEFKRYIIFGGYGIDTTSFEVTFKPPMNFASYRKTELDASLINTYMPLNSLSYVSKQFILKKMGWTQDEIIENEKYWLQENPNKMTSAKAEPDDGASLQSVGIPSPDDPSSEIDDTEQVDVTDENTQSTTFDPNSVGDTF